MTRTHLRSARGAAILALALVGPAACDDPGAMARPDMAMATPPPAYLNSPDAGMPANLGCIGTRQDPPAPTTPTTVMGNIEDFQNGYKVQGAIVRIYLDSAQVINNQPVAESAPSDAMGNYTVTVPPGQYRIIIGNSGGKAIGPGSMVATIPTIEFDRAYDTRSLVAVTESTRDLIPGLVAVIPDPALGVIAGSVRDCDDREYGGAVVGVSMTSMPYDSARLLFYFKDSNGTPLPVRTQRWTSELGVYAALNVPPGMGTVSASAVVGAGGLQMVGSATVPVPAGSITIVDVRPTKRP